MRRRRYRHQVAWSRWRVAIGAVVAAVAVVVRVAVIVRVVMRSGQPTSRPPERVPIRHVFVVMLENKDAGDSFGPSSPARYLSRTLTAQGAFLSNYYGVTHNSLGNYLALISGQGATPEIQSDCRYFRDFVGTGFGAHGQALGRGCVYPPAVKTLPDQLTAHGLTWKGYMEDMGNNPRRESAACGHPTIGEPDFTNLAQRGDQYSSRHNPFVYFHSIIDSPRCAANVVPLSRLSADLRNPDTVPNFAVIAPNLCNDGHDIPCVTGAPGGLTSIDGWLRRWVPVITSSRTFQKDGLLLITFDEAEGDSAGCCGEAHFPNTRFNGWSKSGVGGGRVGAVAISPFIRGGTVTQEPYNHFSTLRTIENVFGLPPLGYAASPNPGTFGADVFTRRR